MAGVMLWARMDPSGWIKISVMLSVGKGRFLAEGKLLISTAISGCFILDGGSIRKLMESNNYQQSPMLAPILCCGCWKTGTTESSSIARRAKNLRED